MFLTISGKIETQATVFFAAVIPGSVVRLLELRADAPHGIRRTSNYWHEDFFWLASM